MFEPLQSILAEQGWSIEIIENNIGLPGYFERMVKVVKERMDMYCEVSDWKLAADYLWYLLEGTLKKFPMLEDEDNNFCFYLFKAVVASQYEKAVLDYACSKQRESLDDDALETLIGDLISATGLINPLHLFIVEIDNKDVKMLSKNDLRALNQVWEVLGDEPLREVIAELEMLEVRYKREGNW